MEFRRPRPAQGFDRRLGGGGAEKRPALCRERSFSRAWSWYEAAQGADTNGPLAGVPYDGKLTKADGKGLWWDGLDPQDLYAQNHAPGKKLVWDWNPAKGSSTPDAAYMEKFFKRTKQLWDDYHPDHDLFRRQRAAVARRHG